MTLFERTMAGLEEVEKYRSTGEIEGVAYDIRTPPLDVKAIREDLNMSQRDFAEAFRFSVKTIQNWEQGIRTPEGPARAYLVAIHHDAPGIQAALQKHRAAYKINKVERVAADDWRHRA